MRALRDFVYFAFLVVVLASPASAQFGRPGPGQRPPEIRGILNPVIGSGAVYQSSTGETEIGLVGKEDVGGKQGYWIQIKVNSPEGEMYIKQLRVADGNTTTLTRVILQPPQGGPMEMPTAMFGQATSASVKVDSRLVGTENVKTAAGTFKCEHYQANDGSWDSWVAADVPPWGLVKSKDGSGEMVLLRTLTGVADRVKGTPQKLELPEGMPNRTRPSRANPSQ